MGMTAVRTLVVAWTAFMVLVNMVMSQSGFLRILPMMLVIWGLGLMIFLGILALFSENSSLTEAAKGAVGAFIGAVLVGWIGIWGFLILAPSIAYMFRSLWLRRKTSPSGHRIVR